jgi:type IV secretory pathway TrbL component
MRKKTGPPQASLKKDKNLENQEKPRVFCVFFAVFLRFFAFFCVFLAFFCVFCAFFLLFFLRFFVVLFSSSQGPLFLCEVFLATQIFDVISCGPGKLDLSRFMLKKSAMQLFPISDPYPAGTTR